MRQKYKSVPIKHNWLIIFADLISLLLVFFILIYIVIPKKHEWPRIASSIVKYFNPGNIALAIDEDNIVLTHNDKKNNFFVKNQEYLFHVLQEKLASINLLDKANITLVEDEIILTPLIKFLPGEAKLTKNDKKLVMQLASIIDLFTKKVTILGVFDDGKFLHNRYFHSRFALSFKRAELLQQYFIDAGFSHEINFTVTNVKQYEHDSFKIIISYN